MGPLAQLPLARLGRELELGRRTMDEPIDFVKISMVCELDMTRRTYCDFSKDGLGTVTRRARDRRGNGVEHTLTSSRKSASVTIWRYLRLAVVRIQRRPHKSKVIDF